jgi:hypothetical protein
LVLLFAITLFISAFLLFLVQPMVGKMILPSLGGTPAVWNTCMVFFQAVLLAGYAFAHQSVSWLGPRRQAVLQIVLLLAPLAVLPIAIDTSAVPSTDNPVPWLSWRLLLGVGLPFFVVSTSAPLLQRWFSETGHVAGKDPYFLYSASNLGSLLALLAYPTLVERALPLASQSRMWMWGYVLLAVMVASCAIGLWRSSRSPGSGVPGAGPAAAPGSEKGSAAPEQLGVGRCLRWVMLAFVPSSLMLGLTTFITTDLAPVPLLWVIPLALYLLTFVWVFGRRPPIRHERLVRVFPFVMVPMTMLTILGDVGGKLALLPLHLVVFFLVGLVCHGELAADRPSPARLTLFYLLMSVGGVLGGLFNAVVAPLVFDSVVEYPLVMALACLLAGWRAVSSRRDSARTEAAIGMRSDRRGAAQRRQPSAVSEPRSATASIYLDFTVPLLLGAAPIGLIYALLVANAWSPWLEASAILVLTVLCLLLWKRWIRFSLTFAVILLGLYLCSQTYGRKILYAGRDFYGPKEVEMVASGGQQRHVFLHGNTLHGVQWTSPSRRKIPTSYFHPSGPAGDVFWARSGPSGPPAQVAILGLGAGAMAAYAKPGQHFTFYEIDPEVERIARDPELFTYLRDCRGTTDVVLGDGRLTLSRAPNGRYGLILLDAFSSDAIPTHLLTREALRLYLSKLDEHGFLVFQVTNRYLNLPPLLAALAQDAGLICRSRHDPVIAPEDLMMAKDASQYVVLARRVEDLGALAANPEWKEIRPVEGSGVWTDQYTNIFRLLRW